MKIIEEAKKEGKLFFVVPIVMGIIIALLTKMVFFIWGFIFGLIAKTIEIWLKSRAVKETKIDDFGTPKKEDVRKTY